MAAFDYNIKKALDNFFLYGFLNYFERVNRTQLVSQASWGPYLC